ncbi:hypothetical protein ACFX12_034287 [Malus domestica]
MAVKPPFLSCISTFISSCPCSTTILFPWSSLNSHQTRKPPRSIYPTTSAFPLELFHETSAITKPMFMDGSSVQSLDQFIRHPDFSILDVSNNRLTIITSGFFSDCGKLGGLKLLNFSVNNLVGCLHDFVRFLGLEALDFAWNNLSGNC